MKRAEAGDLLAFLAVAEAGGFTRAAAQLGTSQSALSHTVRRLETGQRATTLWPSGWTPAFVWARQWLGTWWRYASVRTCAWP